MDRQYLLCLYCYGKLGALALTLSLGRAPSLFMVVNIFLQVKGPPAMALVRLRQLHYVFNVFVSAALQKLLLAWIKLHKMLLFENYLNKSHQAIL